MKTALYATYKNSNSQWLGDIPNHWEVKKLKFLAVVQPSNVDKKTVEGEEPVLLCNYTDVYKNEYIDGRLDFMRATATNDEIKKFAVDIGDVIVTKDSETPDDIAIPACVAEKIEGLLCGYHLTQIKPVDLAGRYLFRLFQSTGFSAQFTVAANGVTRFGLPQYAIANAFSPVPPIDEQKAIAQFLDYKTAQIDALIAKKEALLTKLAEKRTALISHAVTKGLDPSVPMKDSGVEWLGEVPEHWTMTRLKYATSMIVDCPHETPQYSIDGDYFVIRTADLSLGLMDLSNAYRLDEAEYCKRTRRALVKPGDILYGREGERWGFAATVPASPRICLGQRMMQFRTAQHFDARFLMWHINADCVYQQGSLDVAGSTAPHVNVETIKNYWLVAPRYDEQEAIAKYLDDATKRIENQAVAIKKAISRLQEYRSALITNAVTGKIDVRNFPMPGSTSKEVRHA
ncbi:MAG: restriction endonuclease subunit S [Rhodocyclaceae bacterium]|nr:restriction endonuclease subunit S [Rhodocyclaceae bacterium]